jgi:hypothetical protein
MDSNEIQIKENQAIRGYIMRALAQSNKNSLQCKVVAAMLIDDKLVNSPDIAKHLNYLADKEYIKFHGTNIDAFNAVQNDGIAIITAKGIDLIEGSFEDPGVNV